LTVRFSRDFSRAKLMSLNLYSTALIWDGRRGAAKLHGRQIVLGEAPALLGAPVVKIDYRPEIGQVEGRIQRMDGPTSDMTIAEVAAVDEYLRHAVIGATIGVVGAQDPPVCTTIYLISRGASPPIRGTAVRGVIEKLLEAQ
jgi:hypothetical protein